MEEGSHLLGGGVPHTTTAVSRSTGHLRNINYDSTSSSSNDSTTINNHQQHHPSRSVEPDIGVGTTPINKTRPSINSPAACDGADKLKVDDILNFIGYGPLQAIAFVLAGLTAISYGLESAIFAFIDVPIQDKWNLSTLKFTILPATTGVSNIIGGFLYAYLCDNYGRVWPYALALAQIGIFGLASAFSPNFITLIVLRNVVSVAITGAANVLFPTFLEFLPVRNRGKIMVSVVLISAVGVCASGGLAWWLIPTYKVEGWRYLLIATSIPQLVAVAYRLIFHLQSPRFLIAKGRYKEARKIFSTMARLNRKNLNEILPEDVPLEDVIGTHRQSPSGDETGAMGTGKIYRHDFKFTSALLLMFKPPYLRTTVLLSIIFIIETAGFYVSSLFLPKVLLDLGANPYFTAFVGYLGQIPGILLMSIIMEWPEVGRLNALRLYSLLTVVSFLLFAFVRNEVALPVFTVFIYFSMVPMISLLYTYMAEFYPTVIRTFATGFINNLSAFFGIFMPFLSGYLSGVKIYWLYPTVWAGLFFVQFLLSLLLNRETLGTNLIDNVT